MPDRNFGWNRNWNFSAAHYSRELRLFVIVLLFGSNNPHDIAALSLSLSRTQWFINIFDGLSSGFSSSCDWWRNVQKPLNSLCLLSLWRAFFYCANVFGGWRGKIAAFIMNSLQKKLIFLLSTLFYQSNYELLLLDRFFSQIFFFWKYNNKRQKIQSLRIGKNPIAKEFVGFLFSEKK